MRKQKLGTGRIEHESDRRVANPDRADRKGLLRTYVGKLSTALSHIPFRYEIKQKEETNNIQSTNTCC